MTSLLAFDRASFQRRCFVKIAAIAVLSFCVYSTYYSHIVMQVWYTPGVDEVTLVQRNSSSQKGKNNNDSLEEKVKFAMDGWVQKVPQLVGRISPAAIPSAANKPFVFFHQRKTGGSTLRKMLNEAAQEKKLTRWIPCETGGCVPYSLLPNYRLKDVYASHLKYVDMANLKMELTSNRPNNVRNTINIQLENNETEASVHTLPDADDDNGENGFDCLTNLRPTVDRVVSCWNFRFKRKWKKLPAANELSAGDWKALLPVAYDEYMGGCNNEIVRIFGSKLDERWVNTLSLTDATFLHELNQIASRMSRCVIIVPDRCEESVAVMQHYLPWFENSHELCTKRAQASTLNTTAKAIQSNSSTVILAQNQMDELMFQFGEALFEQQLKIAAAAYNATANMGGNAR